MGQLEADEMIRRIKVLYARQPEWLREAHPLARPPNASAIEWANGSRVKSLPASQNAGSGFTASLVIMDEAAKIQFASQLYTALKPTIDGGGQLIILSTANGIGNLFHKLWTQAAKGLSSFKPIFLPWWVRPGRDAEWYAKQKADYTDPHMVSQEYPGSSTEAFLSSGRVRFEADWIAGQAKNIQEPLELSKVPDKLKFIPKIRLYSQLATGRKYILSADVAEGLEDGDYSTAVLLDDKSWEEIASIHGRWEPDEFGVYLDALGRHFDANVVVERNNHGHAVLLKLDIMGYPHIAKGHDGRPGWLTNVQTKPQAIDALAVGLRDGLVTVRTEAALDEMSIYSVLTGGKTGAPPSYHDDIVMAWANGLGWLTICKTKAIVFY